MKFLKLDLGDEDNQTVTRCEAESLDALLDAEARKAREDDRLEPCFGHRGNCVARTENTVTWTPGDGGVYTMAVCAPDTEEGREELQEWTENRLIFPE